jgi:hypothetical protein
MSALQTLVEDRANLNALFDLGLIDRDFNFDGDLAPRKLVMDCSITNSTLTTAHIAQHQVGGYGRGDGLQNTCVR